MNLAAYTGSLLEHLRTQPVDHRIIVQPLYRENCETLKAENRSGYSQSRRLMSRFSKENYRNFYPKGFPKNNRMRIDTTTITPAPKQPQWLGGSW